MKVLVLGACGMLGHKLVQTWKERFDVTATVRADASDALRFGIFDGAEIVGGVRADEFSTVAGVIDRVRPDVIFNAIGIVKQLPTSKNVVTTLTVNSIFPHLLAGSAAEVGARLITISTDCVFDGVNGGYTESSVSNATDLYGRSKSLGEVVEGNCLTIRTSIIGRELSSGHSLVEWFLGNRGRRVKGFRKAIYSGFPTVVLADIVADLIESRPDLNGLWQVSSDPIDKFELLRLMNDAYGARVEIDEDNEFAIDRSLDSTRFRIETGYAPPSWADLVATMADDATPYDEIKK